MSEEALPTDPSGDAFFAYSKHDANLPVPAPPDSVKPPGRENLRSRRHGTAFVRNSGRRRWLTRLPSSENSNPGPSSLGLKPVSSPRPTLLVRSIADDAGWFDFAPASMHMSIEWDVLPVGG
jgi:hypothetical protein